jgi:hypothetical protein
MSRSFKNSFVYCIDKLDIINHKSIKMKKILCLFIATAFLASCETNVTEETDKIAGKWLREGNRLNKGYMAGNQRDYDIVKKFMDAYENMDAESMVELSSDTLKFHPSDLSGVFNIDMTNTDFINERQSNWDSISRDYVVILPLKMEGSKNRVVTTMFTEARYVKDGTVDSINFYERLYLNENDKIVRVVQFSRPTNE